jgi:enamine deaminase RidA (YjgF/YER057c/UK114 family)
MSFEAKLQELGIELPDPPKPAAKYVPAKQAGDLLFVAGQIPFWNGELKYTGKVGAERSEEEAFKSAEICALNAMAVAKSFLGSLDKIAEVVHVRGFINCVPEFTNHPEVMNGASEMFGKVFGDQGTHARAAVGTNSLPRDVTTEVETIFRIKS